MAHMGIGKVGTRVWWEDLWERVHLEYVAVDRRVIVRLDRRGLGSCDSEQGQMADTRERGNEL